MSRSYYEWMKAKRAWYEEQDYRKANIPYPIEDAVVYQRESTNWYWEKRRSEAASRVPDSLQVNAQQINVAQFLSSMAQYEREKENKFLEQFYDGSKFFSSSTLSRTDKFNYLFQSRELYSKLNNRIKDILKNRQNQKNKTYGKSKTTTHEYFTGMAPNLSSVFASYFEDSFNEQIQHFYTKVKPTSSIQEISDLFEEAIKNAVISASERMAAIVESERTQTYGSGEEWAPVLAALQWGGREYQLFVDNLKNAIGYSNLETLRDMLVERKKADNKRIGKNQIKNMFQENLKGIKSRQASIGGSILEIVSSIIANTMNQGNNNYQMLAEGFGGSKVVTDTVMLYSANMRINLQKVMDELRDAMYNNDIQKQTQLYNALEKYYDKQDEKLNDIYQVFVNAKNYGIGADGRDYTKTTKGNLEELPEFLNSAGINIKSVTGFMNFLVNTGEGAIRENQADEAREQCVNLLKMAAAKLMFDDYQTLGLFDQEPLFGGTRNSIHMFLLDGIYVPSSEVFSAMAKAAKDAISGSAKESTKAQIQLPNGIKDNGPEWSEIKEASHDDATFKEKLYEHWKEEYREAKAAIYWQASFTLRIKDILSKAVKLY